MKEKYCFYIIDALLVVILAITLYNVFNKNNEITTRDYSVFYKQIESDMKKIEKNMNKIADSEELVIWSGIKDANFKDAKLEKAYNLLVDDIRYCYLLYDELDKGKKTGNILQKELSQFSDNCLGKFDKYNTLTLSDDQYLSERIKSQIDIIIDYEKEDVDYENLIYNQIITVNKIANLTNWLKVEYYSRNN